MDAADACSRPDLMGPTCSVMEVRSGFPRMWKEVPSSPLPWRLVVLVLGNGAGGREILDARVAVFEGGLHGHLFRTIEGMPMILTWSRIAVMLHTIFLEVAAYISLYVMLDAPCGKIWHVHLICSIE